VHDPPRIARGFPQSGFGLPGLRLEARIFCMHSGAIM